MLIKIALFIIAIALKFFVHFFKDEGQSLSWWAQQGLRKRRHHPDWRNGAKQKSKKDN